MGSLPSSPPPPLSPENPAASSRIYCSFCPKGGGGAAPRSNWLECYTPADNTWRRVSPIPGIPDNHFLKCFAMVSLGDSVYIIGGCLCRRKDESSGDEVDLAVRRDVLRLNTTTGEWSVCAPLLVPRFDFACAAVDGRIYAAGGQCTAPPLGRGTAAAEVYEPAADRWDPLPGMSTLRHKCVGVGWRGRFHAVGGFAQAVAAAEAVVPFGVCRSSAEAYDAGRGEWEVMPGMWQLDVPPNQIVAVGGRLFSSGDCLNTWKGHIEAYDGKLNIWHIVEGSHMQDLYPSSGGGGGEDGSGVLKAGGVERCYLTMAPIGTRLYFLAGYGVAATEEGEFRSVKIVLTFDTAAAEDVWRRVETMEEAAGENGCKQLCAHCCVVHL